MTASLDFYFFIGSTYSYLSVNRAAGQAQARGAALVWRPFSLRTLMREQRNVPFADKPAKQRYMWRDLSRRAARFGIPFDGTPPYPIDADERANRIATVAAREGWCPAFAQAAFRAWFLGKQDPGEPEALRAILDALGQDADRCLAMADSEAIRGDYAAHTDRARELGIFGSPTFVHGAEIFWGDDRLEDALDWALGRRTDRGHAG